MNKVYDIDQELNKHGLTRETYLALFTDANLKSSGESDIDWTEIKNKYGLNCNYDTIRKGQTSSIFGGQFVYQFFNELDDIKTESTIEEEKNKFRNETSINSDGTRTSNRLIVINEDDIKNPSSLLKAHGFDTKSWELVSARNNIWNVYSKKDGVNELYSSKIVVKPRTNISMEEISDFYKTLVEEYKPPVVKKYDRVDNGIMVETPIFDLHLGKLSSSDIVTEEYNSKIARDCFNYVIDETINRLKDRKIEKVLFPIGQDFFHFDNAGTLTTGGTPQDSDVKHQQLFKDGVLLLIDGISKLSKELNTQVDVFVVQGNHDFMTSYHAVMSLWCYFNNNENVTVDLGTSPRKYRQYGNCLIGYTHGDKEKKRIKGLMQVEAKESWGTSKYREWHMGHLHSEQLEEDNGIIFRNLPSVTGTDAWHHNSGYVGAVRKCQCFLWDKEYGLDTIFNIVIKQNV